MMEVDNIIAIAKDSDILHRYRDSDPEGRYQLLMENYAGFPKMLRKLEKKIEYKIKTELEYSKSKKRGELGVRVQTSDLSDPTANEAIVSVTIQEGYQRGELDKGLLKGMENAKEYEEEVRVIGIMRMDFELLDEIINDLEDTDSKLIKQYVQERRYVKEIAAEEGKSYNAIMKKITRIRADIKEEILECLEMNCRFEI